MSQESLTRLTPDAGVLVATGTPVNTDSHRKPTWARWGSLWVKTSGEVGTASLQVTVRAYAQGAHAGAETPFTWWAAAAAITTNGAAFYALGPNTAEDWVTAGWTEQTVIAPPAVFDVRLLCSGGGASFQVAASMDWFA